MAGYDEAAILRDAPQGLSRFYDLVAEDRKRPVGMPAPWAGHRRQKAGAAAVAAGYQMRRGLVPHLVSWEVEPGVALAWAASQPHEEKRLCF